LLHGFRPITPALSSGPPFFYSFIWSFCGFYDPPESISEYCLVEPCYSPESLSESCLAEPCYVPSEPCHPPKFVFESSFVEPYLTFFELCSE
jgi:hypothetical protein